MPAHTCAQEAVRDEDLQDRNQDTYYMLEHELFIFVTVIVLPNLLFLLSVLPQSKVLPVSVPV